MKIKDPMGIHGAVTILLQDSEGNVKQSFTKDNLIVDVGFDFIANAIGKATGRPVVMSHIAVGTGTASPAAGNTGLGAQVLRKTATYAHTDGTKVFTFTTTFNAGEATGALTEAGVANAASGGVLLDRVTFPVVNKGADDVMTVTFTFTMS